jgi:hypothetical protein
VTDELRHHSLDHPSAPVDLDRADFIDDHCPGHLDHVSDLDVDVQQLDDLDDGRPKLRS